MPIGEVTGELIIRPLLEIVLYGLAYWTGFVFLKTITFGTIRLAPLMTIEERNRSKRKQKWYQSDWNIWLHRPMQGRFLKAECTLIVGILVWVAVGCGIYFTNRDNEATANKPHRATTTSRSVAMISPDYNPNPVIDARPRW